MEISCIIDGDIALLTFRGNFISLTEAAETRERIYQLVGRNIRHVVCDLGEVNYMSSLGLGALISAFTTLRKQNGDLRLVRVGSRVQNLLAITKLDSIFTTYASVEEAFTSYNHQPQ